MSFKFYSRACDLSMASFIDLTVAFLDLVLIYIKLFVCRRQTILLCCVSVVGSGLVALIAWLLTS